VASVAAEDASVIVIVASVATAAVAMTVPLRHLRLLQPWRPRMTKNSTMRSSTARMRA
jgi:hypothetical protein